MGILAATAIWPVAGVAEEFRFANGQNGITGETSATLMGTAFTLQITAGPEGAVLNEQDSQGLGVDSRLVPAAIDDYITKFNLVAGSGPFQGEGERITLVFDRPGQITGLDFDGVKDETLEYFVLEADGLNSTYFFDSMADPGSINLPGDVAFLLEGNGLDDEIFGLSIPFEAGQELTIRYGELLAGNGSRFEGITVQVPEPTSLLLAGASLSMVVIASRMQSR
jgi:hypothetical protein